MIKLFGRPFDAGQDFDAIARDHDEARIGARVFFGVFRAENVDGDPRGGPTFTTAEGNIFADDIDREVLHQTGITIRGRDYVIDGREPDGRGGTVKLLLSLA